MKLIVLLLIAVAVSVRCFSLQGGRVQGVRGRMSLRMSDDKDPLLLRAARGEEVERVPVWMMRQAGRHMQVSDLNLLWLMGVGRVSHFSGKMGSCGLVESTSDI